MAEQVSGQLSKDYAVALVKLGDLARKRGAWQESTDYYNKALVLGDRPEAFSALINLGRDAFRGTVARAPALGEQGQGGPGVNLRAVVNADQRVTLNSDPGKALEYLKRARNVANNGNDMGTAMTWMAQVRQREPDGGPEAETLYRGAMAAEDADSAEQALTLEFYAQFLKTQDRAVEAGPIEARAKAIRRVRISTMGSQEAAVSSPFKVGPESRLRRYCTKWNPSTRRKRDPPNTPGTVLLKIVVDVDGRAKDIEVVNGIGTGFG